MSLGFVELDIVSVMEADDGNYTCIAQLPGPQLFRIMAYSVSIGEVHYSGIGEEIHFMDIKIKSTYSLLLLTI